MPEIDIERTAEGWSALPDPEGLARRAALAALDGAGIRLKPDVMLSLLLSDDDAIRAMKGSGAGRTSRPTCSPSRPCRQGG